MIRRFPDVWTPTRVADTMVDALKWARKTAGPIGPRGFASAQFWTRYEATEKDFKVEGWGEREVADEKEVRVERYFTVEQITLYSRAMHWQSTYLVTPGHHRSALILKYWLKCKVDRGFRFDKWIKEQKLSRTHAYRVRDKALSLIAQGLHRDGERVPEPIQL